MEVSIQEIFCCPLCKGRLERNKQTYICNACGQAFSHKENIYDFRINRSSGLRDFWKKEARKWVATREHEKWVSVLGKYLSEEEFWQILFDGHLKEIEEHARSLVCKGGMGERYDNEFLHRGSISDLHELQIALRYIPLREKPGYVLDLGCGTLRGATELCKMEFEKIFAVDILSDMMSYGYDKLNDRDKKKVILVQADVRFLPFTNSIFDLVFSVELFEHIDAPLLFLLDIRRVLARNGFAVINTWNGSGIGYRGKIREKGRAYYKNGFFINSISVKKYKSFCVK